MINGEFAIGTYEINLLTEEERNYVFRNLSTVAKYIDTAVNYNNDYLLCAYDDLKIISKISACHYDFYDFFIENHLKCLNRDYIDIMLIHSNRGAWVPLAKLMVNDKRFKEIGVSNFTINDILEFKKVTGEFPKYNEIEINPYYVDLETINFCKANGIKIIAYCILGGKYNAMRFVADFSLPYLVAFASHYADIVILRADSFRQTNAFVEAVSMYTPLDDYKPTSVTHKSMQPMSYPGILEDKYYGGELTYNIDCGRNVDTIFKSKDNITFRFEHLINSLNFEMLGDYATYFRYLFRQNYETQVYDYDFLIGDDNHYYSVYLIDDKCGRLTKVKDSNTKIELYRYGV